jgi:hypothetical protein
VKSSWWTLNIWSNWRASLIPLGELLIVDRDWVRDLDTRVADRELEVEPRLATFLRVVVAGEGWSPCAIA